MPSDVFDPNGFDNPDKNRYKVEKQTFWRREFINIGLCDSLDEAISKAFIRSRKYRDGTAELQVKDLRRDSIKYRIGWIDRAIFDTANLSDEFITELKYAYHNLGYAQADDSIAHWRRKIISLGHDPDHPPHFIGT
ncbi:MAG: hypothetical protein ISN29_09645 [Gammaproteobacteria bacterium AqS3]|nr:hypothetical protein [Gammaproteobacteria bacterium AqS3]